MRLEGLRVGDLVLVKVKGRSIYGEVLEVTAGMVQFRPLCPGAGWRHASAREVVAHWRKTGREREPPAESPEAPPKLPIEQLSLPGVHT
jgi:hypothetical protein